MVSLTAAHGPTGKLSPQPWMEAPETRAVIAALTAAGADVRFVGGCVRDALAHRPPVLIGEAASEKAMPDIDIATPDPPDTVTVLLQDAGIKVIPTGIKHGTVTAVIGKSTFEITTLRRDVDTDGRRAVVAFTDDWLVDAGRRDFTINTLSATPDGDVYDPYDGISDLAHGRIRFVGQADERITEDVLRLLRFFRFFGAYGRPPADPDAMAACRKHADKLPNLSGERVRAEMFKILLSPDPAELAVMMRGIGVFEHILPEVGDEAGDIGRLRMIAWLETRAIKIETVTPDPLRRLAALIDTDGKGAGRLAERWRLSNAETLRLGTLAAPPVVPDPEMDEDDRRRALHRLGSEAVRDLALLAWAGELAITPRLPRLRTDGWIALLESCAGWQGVTFPLTGADVQALGIEEGPRIGELLATIEDWWELGGYAAGRADCLEQLKTIARSGPGGDQSGGIT
ncbi:MAG: CCA tRNA nucleotidyltransferase [Rhodospirillales bacterium]|nr:CCA tRNA nucleotidyltransferase [Alphaproteobacteria bacterium]MBL6947638.1 CCA tRNA nucleotidyltransferase [Rhodospirillales bacterium]